VTPRRNEIAEVVRRHVTNARFADAMLSVLDDGVRKDGKWWYVPVSPGREFARTDLYYAVLADLEQEIDEEEGLNILLVPCAAHVSAA
jgi:hypothetical protein